MNNAVIIQARVGSTRLHAKVLKNLCGKTVLQHVVERVEQAKLIDGIIIVTTTKKEDDVIVQLANKLNVKVFRGSENDVLDRYYQAAIEFSVKNIIRITSDCPLIDPKVIDEVVDCYNNTKCDIITNVPNEWEKMTYPRGLDLEIFPFEWLEKAWNEATDKYDREHVSPYIYDHALNRYYYRYSQDYSQYRWTLDTDEDWKVISNIYEHLYHGNHDFYMEDIIRYVKKNPIVAEINKNVEQKLRH